MSKLTKPCPTCNGEKVIKMTREGTEISSNISVPCPHCVGIPEFLEGAIDAGKALEAHEEQRIKREFEREYIRETPINRNMEGK